MPGSCLRQMQEEPRTEEPSDRTSSSSVDLLKKFVQQKNAKKKGASLSDAMDALGEYWKQPATGRGDPEPQGICNESNCVRTLFSIFTY